MTEEKSLQILWLEYVGKNDWDKGVYHDVGNTWIEFRAECERRGATVYPQQINKRVGALYHFHAIVTFPDGTTKTFKTDEPL